MKGTGGAGLAAVVFMGLASWLSGACSEAKASMVYAMSNEATGNQVIAFLRGSDGILTFVNSYPTGGNGTGATNVSTVTPQTGIDPLASQGSLAFSRKKDFLFAVNAGSGSITSFRVDTKGTLTRVNTQDSGGAQPNCLDSFDDLLYVANVGNVANGFDSNITGFRFGRDGSLTPIAGSTRKLSSTNAQPSRILFSPDGSLLVVSELSTNHITTFTVNSDGTTTVAAVANSAGPGPFGSAFLSETFVIVAEAPATASGALSSYMVAAAGELTPVSVSVPNGQAATCWVTTSHDGRFAYTSNTGSDTISSYSIASDGTLGLLNEVASPVEGPGSGPIDSGISDDGEFFFVLNGGNGSITGHAINPDGSLTRVGVVAGQALPAQGAQGLVVR